MITIGLTLELERRTYSLRTKIVHNISNINSHLILDNLSRCLAATIFLRSSILIYLRWSDKVGFWYNDFWLFYLASCMLLMP